MGISETVSAYHWINCQAKLTEEEEKWLTEAKSRLPL